MTTDKTIESDLFRDAAWIWSGDEAGYDDYREARHEFEVTTGHLAQVRKGGRIELSITADALYQVWINGRMLGHGPAKSAKGTRGVDQAGLAGALEAAVRVAQLLNEKDATAWTEARTALIEAINRELWDDARAAYADSLHADGSRSPVASQTTNAMMGIYGVTDEARAQALALRIADNDPALLAYGSPYGLYYVLELYDRFNMVEPIFGAIRHRWGDMVMAGDRTTWETFAEYGGHGGFPTRSRCHPFAAYVIKYLVKYLLGVERTSLGWRHCRIAPQPPAGVTFCRGAVPTPQGLIQVSWVEKNGRPMVNQALPAGVMRHEQASDPGQAIGGLA